MRPRSTSSHRSVALADGWELGLLAPGAAATPAEALGLLTGKFVPAQVPGTVADSLKRAGAWQPGAPLDPDASDAWYRCSFKVAQGRAGARALRFDGLATLCDAWLNGTHLLRSENMFVGRSVEVGALLREDNELWLRFSSLRAALAAKKGRPRWKTRLVNDQQLRFFRTTLLGRMPGWAPGPAAVGPWRAIALDERAVIEVISCESRARLEGGDGAVSLDLTLRPLGAGTPTNALLRVGAAQIALAVTPLPDGAFRLAGEARLPHVERWWPHTHGAPATFAVGVELDSGGERVSLELGRTGFRTLDADRTEEGFALRVNGVEIFCRGACWSTMDALLLDGSVDATREVLVRVRDAGMNVVRIGGTMTWQPRFFHDLCDELGLLVWQDFQLANFDYPAQDAAFVAALREEAREHLGALQLSPSLAVLCGGSEVEQQAAMLGLPKESWSGPIFEGLLPEESKAAQPDVPYVANSPSGGALPFRVGAGVSHYYGVGAYLRPFEDARRSGVRFTSECLAFANVPEPRTVERLLGPHEVAPHHPRWKAAVPRDQGMGWDFDDVRDHYLKAVFGADPIALRWSDPERYLAASRVASGEAMVRTFCEWRRAASTCAGGLVWMLQDLKPGAGWGVLDDRGEPKACFWMLQEILQPVGVSFADEGLDGLRIHLFNERAAAIEGTATLTLLRGGTQVGHASRAVLVPARGELALDADELLGAFRDTGSAYRFGPPGFDAAVATLWAGGETRSAFHFPLGPTLARHDLGLSAQALRDGDTWSLKIGAAALAQYVRIELDHHLPAANYFHLAPGQERTVALRARGASRPPEGLVEALNGDRAVRVRA